jgi:hypothetical protein
LLGTRHPRKEKETALQNKSVEPACLCGEISVCHEQVAPPAEKRPEPYKAEPERAISKKIWNRAIAQRATARESQCDKTEPEARVAPLDLFFRRDALKEQFGKDQTRSDAWP